LAQVLGGGEFGYVWREFKCSCIQTLFKVTAMAEATEGSPPQLPLKLAPPADAAFSEAPDRDRRSTDLIGLRIAGLDEGGQHPLDALQGFFRPPLLVLTDGPYRE